MRQDQRSGDEDTEQSRGALFVLPTATVGQQGPVASWISTAGWAAAARRLWGRSWIITPNGVVSPEEASATASIGELAPRNSWSWTHRFPTIPKTALKDLGRFRTGRQFRPTADGPWADSELLFVWQRHEPFCVAGAGLREALHKPLVVFVAAPVRWEATQWGVRRPGWGRMFEARAERPMLVSADLVACGSRLVAEVVRDLGVPEDRILVTPSGVDVTRFSPSPQRDVIRERLGLTNRYVVGWSGSFRKFHNINLAVAAVSQLARSVPEATLLLAGDGPEHPVVAQLCEELAVDVVFTGTVPHSEVPHYLSAMDVALALSPAQGQFHYSPLKVWEYLACGLPVIAPAMGQLAELLTDGVDAVLVPPDDPRALADALEDLFARPAHRAAIGEAARAHAVKRRAWDVQLARVEKALGVRPPRVNGFGAHPAAAELASTSPESNPSPRPA